MRYTQADRVFDELLVISIRSGDRRATERLAARWHPRLVRTATRILGNTEQGLDAAQDCWMAMSSSWMRLEDPRRFPSWAFSILYRKCADIQRRLIRDREGLGQLEQESEAIATSTPDDRIAINSAFAQLSPDHRAIAVLFFAEGLTLIEISGVVDIPVGTVKSRLFNARKHLKTTLERKHS